MSLKLASAAMAALACVASAQSTRSVWDGVFSNAQAQRGEAMYPSTCAGCHGANLEGKPDPSLIGPAFIDRWREDNLSTLYNHISTRMPARAPGSLTERAYLDLLAFILRSNDMPVGAEDLTAAATANIRLIRKEGPQPLPTNAVILAVGCFTAGPPTGNRETWTLTRSSEPLRAQEADETSPAELQRSAAMALGSQTYRLQNLDFFRSDFDPAHYKGQKVQVKGVLIRQTNNDRINVTAFDGLGAGCD
ncbi:MAG TPA: cytochrome c [Bryobacteraceae bacterium]|nr:cytochrome c [Bryobacteraceae bacterium]